MNDRNKEKAEFTIERMVDGLSTALEGIITVMLAAGASREKIHQGVDEIIDSITGN